MKDLSIKVSIANRVYPLTIDPAEEENVRLAAKKINEMVKDYEDNYAVKDKQDLLAMSALHFASQSLQIDNKGIIIDEGITERLEQLNQLIEKNT